MHVFIGTVLRDRSTDIMNTSELSSDRIHHKNIPSNQRSNDAAMQPELEMSCQVVVAVKVPVGNEDAPFRN